MRILATSVVMVSVLTSCGTPDLGAKVADCSIQYPTTCPGYQDNAGCKLEEGKEFSYEPTIQGSVVSVELFNSQSYSTFPPGLELNRVTGVISGTPESASVAGRLSYGIIATCSGGGTASTTVSFVY